MLRGIKIRLYPNKAQTEEFNKILGCYRFVYNRMLSLKQRAYEESQTNLSMCDLSKHFHNELLKDPDYAWLAEQNTKVMKQSIRQMLTAYDNFFHHRVKFPRFKSKKDNQSALFPREAISKRNTFDTRHIILTPSLGRIAFRCSDLYFDRLRRLKDDIKSATLSKTKSGNWFLSVLVDIPDHELVRFKHTGGHVGIDLGVKDFVITSDGEVFSNPKWFRKSEKHIAKLQRQMSRKVKGSRNRDKARRKVAKAYERLTRQREAYIHMVVDSLLRDNDIVFTEDLNVQGMLRNHKLAKAIAEVGFHRFMSVLEDKAQVNYKEVVKVDRWYASSKTCHECGYVYKGLTLNEREWTCPVCGTHHDRDVNAARNILREGESIIGFRRPELKPVESPTVDDRTDTCLRSGGPAKQEAEVLCKS